MTCTCDTYRIVAPNGQTLEGVRRLDPDCHKHGLPEPIKGSGDDEDFWPAGHPLRRYAGHVRDRGPDITLPDGYVIKGRDDYRLERPREVEARLLREAELDMPIPPPRRLPPFRACPPRGLSQR